MLGDYCVLNEALVLVPEEYERLGTKWAAYMVSDADEIVEVQLLSGARQMMCVSDIMTLEFWSPDNRHEDARITKLMEDEEEQNTW